MDRPCVKANGVAEFKPLVARTSKMTMTGVGRIRFETERLRLEWAAGQLQTTEDSLSAIAFKSGFSDQSHFTRAFKQHTGHPPGRFRVLTKN